MKRSATISARRQVGAGPWWEAEDGEVHKRLLPYVQAVDQRQLDHFDRFALLDALYDPNGAAAQVALPTWRAEIRRMTENLIASNVDTVRAQVGATEVRARFLTDGASWSAARRAAQMEHYAEEMATRFKVAEACETGFFDTVLKGTGLVKVYADQDDQVHVEPLMLDNVVVDDIECMNGAAPRQLHYRQLDRDRDELMQQFPEFKREIERAKGGNAWTARLARWRSAPLAYQTRNDVFVVESWRLPLGVPDTERYVPGCHAIVIDGCDLLVEEWDKPHFGIAGMRWSPRRSSFYGIGLGERAIGWQRIINKRGWHMEKVLDRLAMPTTYVSQADAVLRVQETEIGRVVPLKGSPPVTQVPFVIGPELAADRVYARDGAFRETGVSQMAASSSKPAGIEAGVALREWRDMGTDRFAMQQKGYERFCLDVTLLVLDVCKDLGPAAPELVRPSRWAPRKVAWKDVDLGELRVQISASSTLPRTAAGREQTVMEFVQAGLFTLDEARELLDRPDVEKTLSLYTGARRVIQMELEGIELGHPVIPEPFNNLAMAQKLGQAKYDELRQYHDVPEEVMEGVRTYIVQAAHMATMAPTDPTAAGLPPGPPGATPQQVPTSGPPLVPAPTPQLPPMT